MDDTLSEDQIRTFLEDGVLVVDNVLTQEQLAEALQGLDATLATHGVDTSNLPATGHLLSNLSSTNGSGGVLDLFYDSWKLRVATNRRLFHITQQLWQAAYYCHNIHTQHDLDKDEECKWHPFGTFDTSRGHCYIDRIGYRLPSQLAEEIGSKLGESQCSSGKKKKSVPLQRSLTPHLDCCPENLFKNKTKWRPIQCFVSLTDNLHPNTGGFEAARGFHREFAQWARSRPPSIIVRKVKNGGSSDKPETLFVPAPCIGEYTHIRPKEDASVMQRIQHIPVRAGSAVFWDNRIPHANAYRHTGTVPRSVAYCSFLPDIPVNREYAARQLENWQRGRNPTDQWIEPPLSDDDPSAVRDREESALASFNEQIKTFSPLARRLLMIDQW